METGKDLDKTQRTRLAWLLLCVGACACQAGPKVAIRSDEKDPHAVADLQKALQGAGCTLDSTAPDLSIVFDRFELGMGTQSFRIRKEGPKVIRVVGGDSTGAMYGGLELAEQITLGKGLAAVQEKARKPYVLRRGLKFNIPWDGRSPSYDDTGAADLAVFRADAQRKGAHQRAVEHLTNAVKEWEAYARVLTGQYKPQLFSRTSHMDWDALLQDVKKEVETVREAAK